MTGKRTDALSELCEVLRSAGATITLYGKPVTESELRTHANDLAVRRIARAIAKPRRRHRG